MEQCFIRFFLGIGFQVHQALQNATIYIPINLVLGPCTGIYLIYNDFCQNDWCCVAYYIPMKVLLLPSMHSTCGGRLV